MKGVVQTPWTDEERAMLRRLRANGVGVTQIGVMMSRSKNAVYRQLRYLELAVGNAPRPAKPPAPRRDTPHRAGAVTLPPLPSLQD
jgi:hypothetical protein